MLAATAIIESSLSLTICKRQKCQRRLDVVIARNFNVEICWRSFAGVFQAQARKLSQWKYKRNISLASVSCGYGSVGVGSKFDADSQPELDEELTCRFVSE
jgi:hypothetical protein